MRLHMFDSETLAHLLYHSAKSGLPNLPNLVKGLKMLLKCKNVVQMMYYSFSTSEKGPNFLYFLQVPKLCQCWYTSSLPSVANGLQVFVVTLVPTGRCRCQVGWLTYLDYSPYSDDSKQEAALSPVQSQGLRKIDTTPPRAYSNQTVSSLSQARRFRDGHLAQAKQTRQQEFESGISILLHGRSPRGSSFFP